MCIHVRVFLPLTLSLNDSIPPPFRDVIILVATQRDKNPFQLFLDLSVVARAMFGPIVSIALRMRRPSWFGKT